MNSMTVDTLEVSAGTKFRRLPALGDAAAGPLCLSDQGRQKHCDRNGGHVLQVQHCGRIVCRECGACWVDEGF